MRFLHYASASVRAVFIVINKQDTVPADSRAEVIQYVQKTAHSIWGKGSRTVFGLGQRRIVRKTGRQCRKTAR